MAFMNNNGFNNQNNQQQGDKPKTNFNIGKLHGEDGIMNVTMWVSDKKSIFTIFSIKHAIGKDPTTGTNVYEQKQPKELPRIFMNPTKLETLLAVMNEVTDPGTVNFVLEGKSNLTIQGGGNTVKFTISDKQLGDRTITFKSTQFGTKNLFPEWNMLKKYLEVCNKKVIYNNLDPDEFGMVMGSNDDATDDNPLV